MFRLRAVIKATRSSHLKIGLSHLDTIALIYLHGTISQVDIVRKSHYDETTVSHTLKDLLAWRLIQRKHTHHYELTQQGIKECSRFQYDIEHYLPPDFNIN